MNEFADELRAAREAKHISLTDLSSSTKIQLKYLRAIENGEFTFLPETYIRAFIRDYAKAVQIDPDAVIAKYEASMKKAEESVRVSQPEPAEPEPMLPVPTDTPRHLPEISRPPKLPLRELLIAQTSKKKWLPVAALILLIVVVALVAILTRTGRKESVSETPFEQVIKEKEMATLGQSDSAAAGTIASSHLYSHTDSLILEGRTSQDVWLRLAIDNDSSKEYLFRPNAVRTWKARQEFDVSLGNAGGIDFRLNGRELGTLGKSGAVVRNVIITRNGIQK
jgi:cytoskeleton protein RodZ